MAYFKKNTNNLANIIILGAGESGVGAAILAQKLGYGVFVSDMSAIAPRYKADLEQRNIAFEEKKHTKERILKEADLVIKSPGIPDKAPLVQQLKAQQTPIIDEIEFAANHTDAKLIAITGTNGKTTTTRLVYHLLKTAGLNVGIGGNIGYSFARQIAEQNFDTYVLEVSSFQLDYCHAFKPSIAVLTNITADHLDRYDYDINNYIASKFRIVQNKTVDDLLVYQSDNEHIQYGLKHNYQGETINMLGLSMEKIALERPVLAIEKSDYQITADDLPVQGRHNYFNISLAVHVALALGLSTEQINQALTTFQNDAHRLESIIELNGVEYINDSKATNVDAAFYALEAMTKPVVWIVGGVDKGNDYSQLFELVKEKVKAIVCLGKDNTNIKAAFGDKHEIIVETMSAREAIKVASLYAEAGDVVLLSPACASFDLFDNYIHRGNEFRGVLEEMYKLMTTGIPVNISLTIDLNPSEQQSDDIT